MLFQTNTLPQDEYLADWPLHYFEIRDINMREACLRKYMETHPESADDKRRLAILERRFEKKKERGDLFIRSFMMILVAYKNHMNHMNLKRQERDLRANLKGLCVLDCDCDAILEAEWRDFASVYLATCASHEYRSTLFGAITLKDEVVAARVASEIDTVTRLAPKQFRLEASCETLRRIMVEAYVSQLYDGQSRWDSYMAVQKEKEGEHR